MKNKMVLAVPKGRILDELTPLLSRAKIIPEKDFFNESSRKLRFTTNNRELDIIRVRSFDVATFVQFGAAALGVVGKDVLMEFDSDEIYAPLDLKIGSCRLSVAGTKEAVEQNNNARVSHIRIATKYPKATSNYYEKFGIQAECVKLNGAMELAPSLGMCDRIVDLVSSGKTLADNGLYEMDKIADISSYLVVNRTAFKTMQQKIGPLIDNFKEAVNG